MYRCLCNRCKSEHRVYLSGCKVYVCWSFPETSHMITHTPQTCVPIRYHIKSVRCSLCHTAICGKMQWHVHMCVCVCVCLSVTLRVRQTGWPVPQFVSRPFVVGDRVELRTSSGSSEVVGLVERISPMSTTIRNDHSIPISIPNK